MGKIKILIAEDEMLSALALKTQLEISGYDITSTVSSGMEAINHSLVESPDLILMDIYLEDEIDGIDAVQEIQKLKKIPVIYITATVDKNTKKRILSTITLGLITKPYQFDQLLTLLKKHF